VTNLFAEVTDALWIARNVQLTDGGNTITAAGYDDAGNTDYDTNTNITLDDNVSMTYTYDGLGRLTKCEDGVDTPTYEYYQNGLLKMVALANGDSEVYHYDALGRRYMIVSYNGSYDTQTFAFMGSTIIGEIDDTDTKEYILAGGLGGGIGTIVYQEAGDDTLTFYSYNHKGDVSALVDESEDIVALYKYDAFGNILTDAIDNGTESYFTFSTREYSTLSGLGHWPVREYDPFTRRWTRLDPAGVKDGLNRYKSLRNNPLNTVDKLGEKTFYLDVFMLHYILRTGDPMSFGPGEDLVKRIRSRSFMLVEYEYQILSEVMDKVYKLRKKSKISEGCCKPEQKSYDAFSTTLAVFPWEDRDLFEAINRWTAKASVKYWVCSDCSTGFRILYNHSDRFDLDGLGIDYDLNLAGKDFKISWHYFVKGGKKCKK